MVWLPEMRPSYQVVGRKCGTLSMLRLALRMQCTVGPLCLRRESSDRCYGHRIRETSRSCSRWAYEGGFGSHTDRPQHGSSGCVASKFHTGRLGCGHTLRTLCRRNRMNRDMDVESCSFRVLDRACIPCFGEKGIWVSGR